jgi:release factor glutamine methyltransferase
MTFGTVLRQAIDKLNSHEIEDAHIEARVLLGHALRLSAEEIYAGMEQNLNKESVDIFQGLIERRLTREPVAHITNHKEFYGLDFYVDRRVLIPRPETELVVELALRCAKSRTDSTVFPKNQLLVADIGTGCGNIAISVALNSSNVNVYATDISSAALEVANLNCINHKVTDRVILLQGNLLEPMLESVDLVLANLPYIKSSEINNLSSEIAYFEPRIALDGGIKGLMLIDLMLKQVKGKQSHTSDIILEIGAGQEQQVAALIESHFPTTRYEFFPDLSGIQRVVKINVKNQYL